MPNHWIKRTFELIFDNPSDGLQLFPVWLLLGPRQVGKSALLRHSGGSARQCIELDDLSVRARALADPALFARELKLPCLIDEIQYAPQLLSEIKRLADQHPEPGSIFLTGSQNFAVMQSRWARSHPEFIWACGRRATKR
jgi:uncharacterized protein